MLKSNTSILPQIGMMVRYVSEDHCYSSESLRTSLFTISEIFPNGYLFSGQIIARFSNTLNPNDYWNITKQAWDSGCFIIFNNKNFVKTKKTRLRFLS